MDTLYNDFLRLRIKWAKEDGRPITDKELLDLIADDEATARMDAVEGEGF